MSDNGGWTCPMCYAVWAPWYPGPCPHPIQYVDTTDTAPDPDPQHVIIEYGIEVDITWGDDDE